jgi:hypothetical protein
MAVNAHPLINGSVPAHRERSIISTYTILQLAAENAPPRPSMLIKHAHMLGSYIAYGLH